MPPVPLAIPWLPSHIPNALPIPALGGSTQPAGLVYAAIYLHGFERYSNGIYWRGIGSE
ncbi:MAG: hypothetical protein WCQ21_06470 [Verrucomicrobiota bacterium]